MKLEALTVDRGRASKMSELRYTKDGVPIFDGAPENFVGYQRAALVYAETVEWKKRPLVGPRLQAALEGSAKLAVEHMAPGWISHAQGASQLLQYLKKQVRAPTLAEAGRTMSRFFYGIKRRRGEGMTAWIVRHDEALLEAKRTLAEAIHEYGPSSSSPGSTAPSRRPRSWHDYSRPGTLGRVSESGTTTEDGNMGEASPETREEEPSAPSEAPDHEEDEDPWTSRHQDTWWSSRVWDSWSWKAPSETGSASGSWGHHGGASRASWDASEAASAQAEKFLPDFVIAWLLLQRSGLDSTERSVLIANLKNQFTTSRVKEALKLAWPDEDIKRRDGNKHSAMFTTEEEALLAEADEENELETPTWENAEEEYAYHALEDDAQEALAALQEARRTLRDAREKQAQMRRNRSFFPSKGSGKQRFSERPPIRCFKCGGPHRRVDCPELQEKPKSEHVSFVFSAIEESSAAPGGAAESEWLGESALAAQAEQALMALKDVITQGKAVIDGGATSSLGSEEAMQAIANLNWAKHGSDGIEILPHEAPLFRFGNNGQQACMATALLQTPVGDKAAKMRIHLHDIPGQPVLLSVKSLRSLGAIIDFERDEAIFRRLDPTRVARLETTESGHQLFPLVENVLQGAQQRRTPFRSLIEDGGSSNTFSSKE